MLVKELARGYINKSEKVRLRGYWGDEIIQVGMLIGMVECEPCAFLIGYPTC